MRLDLAIRKRKPMESARPQQIITAAQSMRACMWPSRTGCSLQVRHSFPAVCGGLSTRRCRGSALGLQNFDCNCISPGGPFLCHHNGVKVFSWQYELFVPLFWAGWVYPGFSPASWLLGIVLQARCGALKASAEYTNAHLQHQGLR